jgi:hypothetical protein
VVRTGKVSLLREHLPQAAARHVEKRREGMINGLQLTIPGEEVRRLLEQRLEDHRQRADWWKREQARTPKEQTEDEPLL